MSENKTPRQKVEEYLELDLVSPNAPEEINNFYVEWLRGKAQEQKYPKFLEQAIWETVIGELVMELIK